MATNTPKPRVLQIKGLDDETLMLVDIYEAQHPVNGKPMTHAELIKRGLAALLGANINPQE